MKTLYTDIFRARSSNYQHCSVNCRGSLETFICNMATATTDFSAKVLEACEAGEKFVEAFYDILDKRRTVSIEIIMLSLQYSLLSVALLHSCCQDCSQMMHLWFGMATHTLVMLELTLSINPCLAPSTRSLHLTVSQSVVSE